MLVSISAATNIGDIVGMLTEIERKHVPFAQMLAINRTVAAAQREVKADMPSRFTLRRDWVVKGLRIKPAKRGQLEATLYTLDWFMHHQEEGATRTPSRRDKMFIPSLDVRAGGSFDGLVLRRMRPGQLLKRSETAAAKPKRRYRKAGQAYAKPLAFIAEMESGKRGLFIRRDASRRLPLVLLYTIDAAVKNAPRWGFGKTTRGITDKELQHEFIKALDHAFKTAKGGAVNSKYVSFLRDHGSSPLSTWSAPAPGGGRAGSWGDVGKPTPLSQGGSVLSGMER